MQLPPPGNKLNEFTIELIISSNQQGGGGFEGCTFLFVNRNDTSKDKSLYLGLVTGDLFLYNGTDYSRYAENHLSEVYSLIHKGYQSIVLTLKNSLFKLFLNNECIFERSSYLEYLPNSKIEIGNNPVYENDPYYRNWCNFNIKCFKLYDRNLNPQEISKTIVKPLYSFFKINSFKKSGTDVFLRDFSGNNNDLQLFGSSNYKDDIIMSNIRLKE